MQPTIEQNNIDSEMKPEAADNKDESNSIDLEYYRKLVRTFIDLRRYKTALFWAEKVSVLSEYDPKDIYWQAQCMFLLREYHRAAHIIKIRGLERTNIFCHYLMVDSLYEAKEYTEAMDLLNSIDLDYISSLIMSSGGAGEMAADDSIALNILANVDVDGIGPTKSQIVASIYLLKGKILDAMDNRNMAMDCFVEALHLDVYCTEALDALVQHEMLLATEEQELMSHLPFDSQCTASEKKIIEKLYASKLKKYNETTLMTSSTDYNRTPAANFGNLNAIKTILEMTEKTKTERTCTEFKRGIKDANSKFFTPIQQNVQMMSPSHKYLLGVKSTPLYSRISKHGTPSKTFSTVHTPPMQSLKMQSEQSRRCDSTAAMALGKLWIPVEVGSDRLEQSVDVMNAKAESWFYNCEYKKCIGILDEVLKVDPYHCSALTILIGCFMELKEYNKLFCIAHKLVDLYSDQAISWYAVGCYYDLIGKSDPARRYLSKATSIDRLFGPAWLAYGHSFAKENEHDQAMAAYFKATQLMRGCHLPLLYIGVECGLTKNLDLSEKFFYQAMSIAPLDVFVLHELGIIKYESEYYEEAEEILRTTLDMVTKMAKDNNEPISVRWEPLINNLGHCCRKIKKYDQALQYHEQALVLKPQSPSTYTAIGFVHAIKGNLERAVDYLHRSLALKRDDIVTTALLKSCLEDLMKQDTLPKSLRDIGNLDGGDEMGNTDRHDDVGQSSGNIAAKLRMKITYDDDSLSSPSIDLIDLDMSME